MSGASVQRAFFFALLFVITAAFIWLIRGFLQPIFWAVALAIVLFPVHAWLARRMPRRPSLAAATSVLLVVLIVVLPLVGLATAVTSEATALYQRISAGNVGVQEVYEGLRQRAPQLAAGLEYIGLDPQRLENQLSTAAVQLSRLIAARAFAIGQDTVRVAVFFVLMLYLLFFFLRDGQTLLDGLIHSLPFGDERERHLLDRFAQVSRATIKGTLVVGIVQGTIGGAMFALLGVGGATLWGVAMALLSILPAVGPALVWLPAAIWLLASGHIVGGTALILVGVFVIGLVDNLLRPLLVGRDTRMPDYLVLLATLGGLAGFGLAGIIIGPIIAALFLSIWQMAEQEIGPESEHLPDSD